MRDEGKYDPTPSEWRSGLVSTVLEMKMDGPLKRRVDDLTREVARDFPDLPPIMWGMVFFAGFMQLRKATREHDSFLAGLRTVFEDAQRLAVAGL